MKNLSIIGFCSLPVLLACTFIYPDVLYYFLVLDSWSILRLSSVKIADFPISFNMCIVSIFFIILILREKLFLPPQRKIILLPTMLFLMWLLVSHYIYSKSLHIGVLNNLIFFYITLLFFQDKSSQKLFYVAIVALLCMFFLSGSMLVNDVLHGAFGQKSYAGNRIHSAFYILEAIILLFFLRERCAKKILYHAINFLIATGYLSIFLCLGRLVTAIAVVSIIFFFYKAYIKWRTIVAGAALLFFIILLSPHLFTSFQKQLIRLPDSRHKTIKQYDKDEMAAFTSGRSRAYEVAWKLYLKKPLMGIGYDRWATDISMGGAGFSLHSRWLQILVETGPVGALLYLFIYVSCFFCLSSKSLFVPGHREPVRDVLLMALVGFCLIGLTDNHGYTDRIFYLIIAFIASYRETKKAVEYN